MPFHFPFCSFQTHALSLRRAVPDRSKPFDDLLKEHKAAKDALIEAKRANQAAAAASSNASLGNKILVSPASMGTNVNAYKLQQHGSPQVHYPHNH